MNSTTPLTSPSTLAPEGDSFRILQKVVRLINGDDYLHSIGYIL